MALYQLDEWEHNEYHDSDWVAVVYNDVDDALESVLTGSTRFANGLHIGPERLAPTPEIRTKAQAALARLLLASMTRSEVARCTEPGPKDIASGTRIRFLAAHHCMAKDVAVRSDPCLKCSGQGKWINPRNKDDVRNCFGCSGSGQRQVTTRTKRKTTEGKQVWEHILAGAQGEVISSETYGVFYRNGYNEPNRGNTTVIVKLDDGREVRAPLEKLRLDVEPIDMTACAVQAAANENYYAPFRTAGVRL